MKFVFILASTVFLKKEFHGKKSVFIKLIWGIDEDMSSIDFKSNVTIGASVIITVLFTLAEKYKNYL